MSDKQKEKVRKSLIASAKGHGLDSAFLMEHIDRYMLFMDAFYEKIGDGDTAEARMIDKSMRDILKTLKLDPPKIDTSNEYEEL